MSTTGPKPGGMPRTMSDLIAPHLPYLRRYARALTGSQSSGDKLAASTLEAVLADPESLPVPQMGERGALFHVFHRLWVSIGQPSPEEEVEALRARTHDNMAELSPNTREALLLHTVEEFSIEDTARIMSLGADETRALVEKARSEMRGAVSGRVMIIEDEAIIAMDLESIVETIGHEVTGIARTRDEAVELGQESKPHLILADIQLADNSSGIDAVNDLLKVMPDVPVIFITAYPERLLTGERPEPAFLIAKPYTPPQVISAVSQAMFFASTETLKAQPA